MISCAVFIVIGLLLSLALASRPGLSEEVFLNLRMPFMLFGPIYLTLIVNIIFTFLAAAKGKAKDTTQKSRNILFANLSNAQMASGAALARALHLD